MAASPPALDEVKGYFESYWNPETDHKTIHFGERNTKASLLDLARRMLAVLYRDRNRTRNRVVEQRFDVPLIDLNTGEVLDRALVGTLDLLERDAAGGLVSYLAFEAVRRKREERHDRKRDALTVEVATRLRPLSGGQRATAERLLAMITQATASDGAANRW